MCFICERERWDTGDFFYVDRAVQCILFIQGEEEEEKE